jgi:hypothetical protein
MGQPNFTPFNKWKKVWVAGILGKKHQSIVRGQNRLKQRRDGHVHWETAVVDILETFETWLPVEHFDNVEWIWRQWVEMFFKKCASKVREARNKGR